MSFSSETSRISFGFDRFLHQFGISNDGFHGSQEVIRDENLYDENQGDEGIAEMIEEDDEPNYIYCNGNNDLSSLSSNEH